MLQGTYPTLSMTTSMLTVSLRAKYLQMYILGCLGVSRILMDKKLLAGALWILGLLGSIQFAGCVPTQAVYQEQAAQIRLEPGEAASIRVSAAVDEWRDTGVDLVAGADYQLTANGKWRTYGTCNFTGPDGVGLYNTLCPKSPLFPQVLSAYSHSTLIGKVGTGGKPFAIGSSLQLSAEEGGRLFLRTNDMIGGSRDNEGFVDIRIVRSGSAHGGAVVAQRPGIPSGTLGAMKGQSDIPRVALVIGNSDYLQSPLKNPENDAKDMAESLQQLGFDVILELNASQQDMEQAVDYFGRRLIGGRHVALFYFAGHGVQVDGSNYLIPVGAAIRRQSDVRYKAVDLGQILGTMGEAEDNLNIVILDACRDNPLPRSFRSSSRGLARVEGPKGTIIGFATSPGSTAADGEGDNGVYTKHLLENMQKPGISIEQFFKGVLLGVDQETAGMQTPWTESSFTGDFSFNPK